ncbi:hypothetical protein GZ77_13375 [Endozoicomonas montiporae]|uniref:HTH tetR-type domain-containing protein n=1 Tax=Endozoicomonas montiporae TaxID=1027273 RepID=A0A081N4L4_9GAMM|nr:hypothetical protein GZ77_13375 [Endozoicomonas montiporae]
MSRRERKKRAVREKIQDELVRLISLKGLENTTVDDLCEAADIAKKTFYNYYGTRQELILEVCQIRLFNRLQENIAVAIKHHNGLAAQLGFIIGEMELFIIHAEAFEKELINYMLANLSTLTGSEQSHSMQAGYEHMYRAGEAELKPGLTPEFCAEMTVAMINALSLGLLDSSKEEVRQRTGLLLTYIQESMLQ